jgi:hypothetical protein
MPRRINGRKEFPNMKSSKRYFFSNHCLQLLMGFFLLVNFPVYAQNRGISFPSNDLRYLENQFYNYNYQLYTYPRYSHFVLDTLNYCRVKTNKIKTVSIYQFYSATDSVLISTINYDSLGMTANLKEKFADAHLESIQCDSVHQSIHAPNKTIVKRTVHLKEIWITDNQGYVIDYKRINRGVFNRWLMNNIGLSDYHVTYKYDSLYQTVTETRCASIKRHFRRCSANELVADCYIYHLDRYGNLLSEFEYKTNEKGERIIQSGYTYHYTYY